MGEMRQGQKTTAQPTERREYPRLDVHLPVILRYLGRLIPATALNVSCGGMMLTADHGNVTTSAPVEVIFDLSEQERDVTLRGEIIRIAGEGDPKVGIKFTNLYAVGHKALERYLNRRNLQS